MNQARANSYVMFWEARIQRVNATTNDCNALYQLPPHQRIPPIPIPPSFSNEYDSEDEYDCAPPRTPRHHMIPRAHHARTFDIEPASAAPAVNRCNCGIQRTQTTPRHRCSLPGVARRKGPGSRPLLMRRKDKPTPISAGSVGLESPMKFGREAVATVDTLRPP